MATVYVDISNYYTTRAHTGIQRVVREFLSKAADDKNLAVQCIYFDLDSHKFVQISPTELSAFLADVKNYVFKNTANQKKIEDFCSTDIFLDMDGVWNNPLKRDYLYKKLKQNQVKIVNFLYDLVPVVKSQFSHSNTTRNFVTYLYAIYQYSDLVLFDSRSAELDFLQVKEKIGNGRPIPSRVIKLGADISVGQKKNSPNSKAKSSKNKQRSAVEQQAPADKTVTELVKTRYLLFVGTLEPRKDQQLLLTAFEQIAHKHPDTNLVFVGKAGWNNDEFLQYLGSHKLLNQSVFWLQGLSDNDLTLLYKHAHICVYLSKYEGFGLPIAESLGNGKLTIASNNSSMFEVGKNCADYISYNSVNELTDLLDLYLSNNRLYWEKLAFIEKNHIHYSWDMMAKSTISVLKSLTRPKYLPIQAPEKLQFVFISIDADKCGRTIAKTDKYIPFVKEYIVVTRPDMMPRFQEIQSQFPIRVIDENKILGKYAEGFAKRDHVSKNWLLRSSLLNLNNLDDCFVMLDDDNQPFKPIPMENFILDGRYSAYYFYDLLSWKERMTEYDEGQHNMKVVLDKDGYELLSYSSHRPQIIDKRIWREVVDKYFDIGLNMPIDEWSMYFNYGVSNYPMLFDKKVFDTLNWPGSYQNWELKYIPQQYNFNNYYPENNPDGQPIADNELVSSKEPMFNLYRNNPQLIEKNFPIQKENNMVHGVLRFQTAKGSVYLSGIPYYFEAKQGTWIDFPLNLKWLGEAGCNVEIGYFINGGRGHFVSVPKLAAFDDRTAGLKISCTSLKAGQDYDLLIDVKIDGKHVYQTESPYLVKLFVF
ncbi:glycosyltransferase family 4 protein [Neisseria sp.]|uniref:glycosyltransferase family 4 protein n=1 Tax=Neisseria sp. TaxID=192066 RepID=UPI0035A013DF